MLFFCVKMGFLGFSMQFWDSKNFTFKAFNGSEFYFILNFYFDPSLPSLKIFNHKSFFFSSQNVPVSVREVGGSPLKVYSIEISNFRPIYVFKSLMSTKLSLK